MRALTLVFCLVVASVALGEPNSAARPQNAPVPSSVVACTPTDDRPATKVCLHYFNRFTDLQLRKNTLIKELMALYFGNPIMTAAQAQRIKELTYLLNQIDQSLAEAENELKPCICSRALANNDTGTFGGTTAPDMIGD